MCIFNIKNLIPWNNRTIAEPLFQVALGNKVNTVSYFVPRDSKSDWKNADEYPNWDGHPILVHHDKDIYFMLANPDSVERAYVFKIGIQ
jgi:hypothetical protein